MKLIKTANGKNQLKMSRKEWESIGKTAGWLYPTQTTFDEKVQDPSKREEYKGFTIEVFPTAQKGYFYTEIDGVLIPNDYNSLSRGGMGTPNAIESGKRAIDKAIMDNPHNADKNTILTYIGKWRDFNSKNIDKEAQIDPLQPTDGVQNAPDSQAKFLKKKKKKKILK